GLLSRCNAVPDCFGQPNPLSEWQRQNLGYEFLPHLRYSTAFKPAVLGRLKSICQPATSPITVYVLLAFRGRPPLTPLARAALALPRTSQAPLAGRAQTSRPGCQRWRLIIRRR